MLPSLHNSMTWIMTQCNIRSAEVKGLLLAVSFYRSFARPPAFYNAGRAQQWVCRSCGWLSRFWSSMNKRKNNGKENQVKSVLMLAIEANWVEHSNVKMSNIVKRQTVCIPNGWELTLQYKDLHQCCINVRRLNSTVVSGQQRITKVPSVSPTVAVKRTGSWEIPWEMPIQRLRHCFDKLKEKPT